VSWIFSSSCGYIVSSGLFKGDEHTALLHRWCRGFVSKAFLLSSVSLLADRDGDMVPQRAAGFLAPETDGRLVA
jgi:hypothetical protein